MLVLIHKMELIEGPLKSIAGKLGGIPMDSLASGLGAAGVTLPVGASDLVSGNASKLSLGFGKMMRGKRK
jgi:hypothetical protein